ncbi:MAG: endo-1,4-beta-xylanase, partial [Candidatus Ornithomonoglobus sp.]
YSTKNAGSSSRPAKADPWINTEITPIKDVYKDYFLIGTACGPEGGTKDSLEAQMINQHFDIVTAGNDMKPDYLEAKSGKFTFNKADKIVDTTLGNGLQMHGHVFVWHEQTPSWLTQVSSREEGLANLKQYIEGVGEHYKGKCYSWDVVNEAIDNITDTNTVSGILRDTPWRRAIGDDYIEYAFKYAAEAVPEAKLYYNDFNLDDAKKADAVVTLVKDLQSKGIRIDGIGMQGHYTVNTSIKAVEESIQKFAALGVKISVSELDVGCLQSGDYPTEAEFIKQAQKYAELFQVYKKYSDVIERVTFWGIDDATSWRAEDYPLIFDMNYQPKEAYYAILDPDKYLEEHPVTKNVTNKAGSAYGTPIIDGEIDEAWNSVPEYKLSRYLMAWQGASGTFKSMWDEDNLYLLVNVKDPVVSAVAADAYMQDSVEAFVDENNGKTTYYEEDDAQFRVSCENVQSYGTNASAERFKTAVKITENGYLVEMAISFISKHQNGDVIGFDAQINDDGAGDGNRTSIAKFNDMTDLSWGNTENWGELELNTDGVVQTAQEPAEDEIKVILNGEALCFDVPPVIVNDTTLVPFRTLFEKLGASVEYIEEGRYVKAAKDVTEISLQIDNTEAAVNGEAKTLETAPVIMNERTLVPLRFASECLDAEVDWNGDTRTITITVK